jgi:chromate transporter
MNEKMKNMWQLFCSFFKIGAFTFGGGYAMIAIIENECVSEKKWLTHDEMMDITVVAESTPGPVAINTATFVGYKVGGIIGSLCATSGVVLPSFVIIYLISSFLNRFLEITWVASAFQGIKAAVAFLIFHAGWKMFKKMKKSLLNVIVFGVCFAAMLLVNLGIVAFSAIYLILSSALLGLVIYGISAFSEKGGK